MILNLLLAALAVTTCVYALPVTVSSELSSPRSDQTRIEAWWNFPEAWDKCLEYKAFRARGAQWPVDMLYSPVQERWGAGSKPVFGVVLRQDASLYNHFSFVGPTIERLITHPADGFPFEYHYGEDGVHGYKTTLDEDIMYEYQQKGALQ